MSEQERKESKEDSRLYSKVRAEKQKVVLIQYERLRPFLDERGRRLWAANEAIGFGRGGIRAVAQVLGMSLVTIIAGVKELKEARLKPPDPSANRQRRTGGGRKSLVSKQPEIVKAIEAIVDPVTRGDPMAPLKWTTKSLKKIQEELDSNGYKASPDSISKILREHLGYTLQALKKTKEGASHEDPECVNENETRSGENYSSTSSLEAGLGGLIQTASGSGPGAGILRTKRSG